MRTYRGTSLAHTLICTLVLVAAACSGATNSTGSNDASAAVALHLSSVAAAPVFPGTELTLIAERVTADSIRVGIASAVTWSTMDAAIATVSTSGVVHIVNGGNAQIIATAKEGTRSIQGRLSIAAVFVDSIAKR